MFQVSYTFMTCVFLVLILPSTSYYIEPYDQKYTVNNGDPVQIYYQPGFCKSETDTCDPNETFNVTVAAGHQCLPTQNITMTIGCPTACVRPDLYLSCTNTFTDQNNQTSFAAVVVMVSNTNPFHFAFAISFKNITWSEPRPNPDNSSSDWAIYVGVSVGVVVLAVIGFIIFKKIQKRKKDNYERV